MKPPLSRRRSFLARLEDCPRLNTQVLFYQLNATDVPQITVAALTEATSMFRKPLGTVAGCLGGGVRIQLSNATWYADPRSLLKAVAEVTLEQQLFVLFVKSANDLDYWPEIMSTSAAATTAAQLYSRAGCSVIGPQELPAACNHGNMMTNITALVNQAHRSSAPRSTLTRQLV